MSLPLFDPARVGSITSHTECPVWWSPLLKLKLLKVVTWLEKSHNHVWFIGEVNGFHLWPAASLSLCGYLAILYTEVEEVLRSLT